jgi:hypothetical protein
LEALVLLDGKVPAVLIGGAELGAEHRNIVLGLRKERSIGSRRRP